MCHHPGISQSWLKSVRHWLITLWKGNLGRCWRPGNERIEDGDNGPVICNATIRNICFEIQGQHFHEAVDRSPSFNGGEHRWVHPGLEKVPIVRRKEGAAWIALRIHGTFWSALWERKKTFWTSESSLITFQIYICVQFSLAANPSVWMFACYYPARQMGFTGPMLTLLLKVASTGVFVCSLGECRHALYFSLLTNSLRNRWLI